MSTPRSIPNVNIEITDFPENRRPAPFFADMILLCAFVLVCGCAPNSNPAPADNPLSASNTTPIPPPSETQTIRDQEWEPDPGSVDIPQISVAIAGAVKSPGFYVLPKFARVQNLIDAAGGPLECADLYDINIAAPLIDGLTLTIPKSMVVSRKENQLSAHGAANASPANPSQYSRSAWRPETSSTPALHPQPNAVAPVSSPGNAKININQASQTELESLPGIGPVTAAKIIDYRSRQPFQSIDDLDSIEGIGPKKLDAVRALITVK